MERMELARAPRCVVGGGARSRNRESRERTALRLNPGLKRGQRKTRPLHHDTLRHVACQSVARRQRDLTRTFVVKVNFVGSIEAAR